MKDQYVGDVNDYCKYALLRALSAVQPGRPNICWMLTGPDGRTDGGKVAYLGAPDVSRSFDPPLFDALGSLVASGVRSVEAVQAAKILSSARFYSQPIADRRDARGDYFDAFWQTLGPDDLVFFDPDNGIEVPSVPKGRRNSSKYLYWDELERALGGDRTVCVYQHFPRRPRAAFLAGLLERMAGVFPDHEAFAVTSPWVAYLICAPVARVESLCAAAADLACRPGSRLTIQPR